MNPYRVGFFLVAFFGLAWVFPAWHYFVPAYAPDQPMEIQFLASIVLPALIILFAISWIQPRGGGA